MRSFCFLFKPKIVFASVVLFASAQLPICASTLWTWQYSNSQVTAAGTFVTASRPNANGAYLITGITGTRNGETIKGLQAPGTSIPGNQPYTVDDLLYPGPKPQLTSHGFGFSLSNGTFSNPFFADFLPVPKYLEFFSTPGGGHTELPVSFSATPVTTPEPATSALALTALVAALALRRKTLAVGASARHATT